MLLKKKKKWEPDRNMLYPLIVFAKSIVHSIFSIYLRIVRALFFSARFTFLTIVGKFAVNDRSGFPFLLKFPCRFVFAAKQNKRSYVFQSRAQIHRSLESHRKSVSFVCIEMLEYQHIKLYQGVRLQS